MLEAPTFHHLHLNATDPEASIRYLNERFESTSRTEWGGQPALWSPTDVLILFTKVEAPPPTAPATALWHFGWHVTDTRAARDRFATQGVTLLPLYTGDGGGTVTVSSDTWPGAEGALGRTQEQILDAKATGVQPTLQGGFGYLLAPDGAIVEYVGNQPRERVNHVHMWQEDPYCAQLWYQTHLNATPGGRARSDLSVDSCVVARDPGLTFPALEPEGMYRTPSSAVQFSDVAFTWYMRQGDDVLAPTRGQVYDHVALGVTDLDAWVAKLRDEGVTFLEAPYALGDTRAFMIEGPSREAIELVEAG